MITALYRISSNEVVKISLQGQPFADRDTTYWGVLNDPPLSDGNVVRESLPDGTLGPLGVIGFAKINDNGTVRNATQGEINGWQAFEDEDENLQDAEDAQFMLTDHPRFRKAFAAMYKETLEEINLLRSEVGRPQRNVNATQRRNQLRGKVSKDD